MNRSENKIGNEEKIDSEILKALLISSQQSVYNIEKTLKKTVEESNYTTVWRHIKKLEKQDLVSLVQVKLRKDGKLDKRNPKKVEITPKGVATLLIEENLQKEELRLIGLKIIQERMSSLPPDFLRTAPLEDIIADCLVKIKPKVNLRFFDEKYFIEIFLTSILESMIEMLPKVKGGAKKETLVASLNALRRLAKKRGLSKEFEDSFELGKMLGSESKKKEE